MRSYGTVKPSFWTGPTGRAIREAGKDVQLTAVYLMTSPHANMLGIYYMPTVLLRKELALTMPEVLKALDKLREVKFADFDPDSETVWVFEMAKYQLGDMNERDGRVKAIQRAYADLQDSPFLGPFFDKYSESLRIVIRRDGSGGGASRGASTGGARAPVSGPSLVPVPVPVLKERSGEETAALARFERFWRAYPKRKAKDDAWKAWQKRKPDEVLTETIVQAVETQCRGPDWLKEGGKFIPHPATWLNQGRWQDEAVTVPVVSEHTIRVARGAMDYAAGKS